MSFSNSFWESDFVSQIGFETLVQRMKEARQACRDCEDFLKQRSKAEEDYAKALLKIARVDRGPDECGTLRSSLELLRIESEMEASVHLTHSQQLIEEANKLSEFREKQRDERKRHEDNVHKVHKVKVENYRRMITCKGNYETKIKAAEKSESDLEKVKFANKPKEIEKVRKNAQQCRQAAVKADEEYQGSIAQLEACRQSWEHDHIAACEIFQRLEEERIQYLRNVLWVFCNISSDVFVKSDESRENIRISLEKCDVVRDIQDFISRKKTATSPPKPILYTQFGSTPSHQMTTPVVNHGGRALSTDTDDYSLATYSSIELSANTFIAMYDYAPRMDQEVELKKDDRVIVTVQDVDGWWRGKNTRTGMSGLFPANYVQRE